MPQVELPEAQPASELRKIIVNATSEMLDDPGENGIYKTGRFYDRLESEINEYMQENPKQGNIYRLMLETVQNSAHVTPELQNVIAKYLDYQSVPPVMITGDMARKIKVQ